MIKGERVALRALEDRDAETLRQWRNHPDLFGYHFGPLPEPEAEQRRWYANYGTSDKLIVWMIENGGGEAVGYTVIKDLDHKNARAEIGLHLDPRHQGKGYGRDAFKTLIRFGFHELNLHRICLEVLDFNTRAVSLYESLGFKHEGRKREAHFTQNAYHDVLLMSILASEFEG